MNQPARWLVDLSLVVVALIWGVTFVVVKRALDDVSILLFLALRFTAATAALAIVFHRDFRGPNTARAWRGGALAGCCLFAGYAFQTFGLRYTSASKTAFITSLYVPLVPLFGALAYRRLPRLAEIVGVTLAACGFFLLTAQGDAFQVHFGDALVTGCAAAFAIHILVLDRVAKDASPGLITVVQIGVAALLAAGTCGWAEPPRLNWTTEVLVALAVTSLLATALAFFVQTWAQRWSSPTRTALLFSLEPVFAWIASYLLAGEALSVRGVAGAALILSGIAVVEVRPFRR